MQTAIAQHHWVVYAGATFDEGVQYKDGLGVLFDLNLYTALMEIRASDGTLVDALSTENGKLVTQVDKSLRILVTDDLTRAYPLGKHKYDLLVREVSTDKVTPLLGGLVFVHALTTQGEPS